MGNSYQMDNFALLLSELTRSSLESYMEGVLERGFDVIWGAVIRGIRGLKGPLSVGEMINLYIS